MKQVERIKQLIQMAIQAIDDRLDIEDIAESRPMSKAQLHDFRQIMVQMASNLDSLAETQGQMRSPTRMGGAIVDSWPLDSEMGEAILAAEQEYWKFIG